MSRNSTQVRVRVVVLPDTCDSCHLVPPVPGPGAWPERGCLGPARALWVLDSLQERLNNTSSGDCEGSKQGLSTEGAIGEPWAELLWLSQNVTGKK